MEDDDEGITIDFGKVKNLFKRKKKDQVKSIEGKVKETKKELKEEIVHEEKRVDELEKDEAEIKEAETIIQKDEKIAEVIDKKEEVLRKDITKVRETVEKAKEDIEKEEEIHIDLKKIKGAFKEKRWGVFFKKYGILFAILIPILLSTFFRMYPSYLPVTDDWARDSVYNSYKSQISSQINQQYPNLPEANKNSLVEDEFNKVLIERKEEIDEQVRGTSDYFKTRFKNDDGQTYLLAIDPYLWYGEARNYVNYGHSGDKIIDGKSVYSLRNGRFGKGTGGFKFHPFMEAALYRIVHFFNRNFTLLRAAFLMPVILIALSIIPTFFITKRFGGITGGLFAGLILAINASLLGRTPAGFSDTDAYSVLVPLIIVWVFLEAFETTNLKKKLILTVTAGFVTGIFPLVWTGWSYIFNFILATIGIYFAYIVLRNLKELKKGIINFISFAPIKESLIILGTYLLSTGIFVSLFNGSIRVYFQGFVRLFQFIRLKEVAVKTLWPNVLTTVAEFNPPQLASIIDQMGGQFLFWISLVGITLLLYNMKKTNLKNIIYLAGSAIYYLLIINMKNKLNDPTTFIVLLSLPIIIGLLKVFYLKEGKDVDIKLAVLLTIWFIGTAYSFTKGVRFAILMVPAFAIAFGIAIGVAYGYLRRLTSKELHVNRTTSAAVWMVIMLLIIGISPIPVSPTGIPFCTHGICEKAHRTALNEIPSMSDAWYESLTAIRDDSEDAIITSWWDFGHWFTAIAGRKVTFDGGDQQRRIHWVGKSLLVDDEKMSLGILRMLNCGQESGFDALDSYVKDGVKSVDILNEIIVLDRGEAKDVLLEKGLDEKAAVEVLELTHCEDLIKQYYITSQDMISKAGVWAHFGSWDFERAKMWQTVASKDYGTGTKILEEDFGLTPEKADSYYYEIKNERADKWISPWPSYLSGLNGCSKNEEILDCGNGIRINLDSYDAQFSAQDGVKSPASFVYNTEEDLVEKKYEKETVPFSIILVEKDGSYKAMLSDPPLAKSMFTRLFFFDGLGSKHYTKLTDKTTVTGEKIIVWKVDWAEHEPITWVKKEKDIARAGDKVTINYIGWLDDGTVFDSSIVGWQEKSISPETGFSDDLEYNPFIFTLGIGEVIPGFDEAVLDMELNRVKVASMPPEMAYGTDPKAHPLGGQTLNFKIKLIKIE